MQFLLIYALLIAQDYKWQQEDGSEPKNSQSSNSGRLESELVSLHPDLPSIQTLDIDGIIWIAQNQDVQLDKISILMIMGSELMDDLFQLFHVHIKQEGGMCHAQRHSTDKGLRV